MNTIAATLNRHHVTAPGFPCSPALTGAGGAR